MRLPSLALLSFAFTGLVAAARSHPHRHLNVTELVNEFEERDVEEHILEARKTLGAFTGTRPKHAQFIYDLTEGAGSQLPPDPKTLQGWTLYAMAFWHHTGPVYNAHTWAKQSKSYQKKVQSAYNKHGIKLLISAFGDEETPTTSHFDPVKTAKNLASFVKSNHLDGVDIDYEDFSACNRKKCAAWLIKFQTALRKDLGSKYIISHAPVAPWFTQHDNFGGAYYKMNQAVGHTVDYYNVQFYNQGKDYADCNSLILKDKSWGASLLEIAKHVPKGKLLIGKPSAKSEVSYGGYMSPKQLKQCVKVAQKHGWNTGIMIWSWSKAGPLHFLKNAWA